LSKDLRDIILHILVPDPDLRFGIKQIKQHKWFNIYLPVVPISKGVRVGIDNIHVHSKIVKEMKEKSGINEKYVE
jgi:serine/threonine protein kinase